MYPVGGPADTSRPDETQPKRRRVSPAQRRSVDTERLELHSGNGCPISRDDPETTDLGRKRISTARGRAVVVTANPHAAPPDWTH